MSTKIEAFLKFAMLQLSVWCEFKMTVARLAQQLNFSFLFHSAMKFSLWRIILFSSMCPEFVMQSRSGRVYPKILLENESKWNFFGNDSSLKALRTKTLQFILLRWVFHYRFSIAILCHPFATALIFCGSSRFYLYPFERKNTRVEFIKARSFNKHRTERENKHYEN